MPYRTPPFKYSILKHVSNVNTLSLYEIHKILLKYIKILLCRYVETGVTSYLNFSNPAITQIPITQDDTTITIGVRVKAAAGAWGAWDDFYLSKSDKEYLKDCTVTFDNGDTITVKEGQTIGSEEAIPEVSREGYNFIGWYTEAEYVNRVATIEKGHTGDITLYAKFTKVNPIQDIIKNVIEVVSTIIKHIFGWR